MAAGFVRLLTDARFAAEVLTPGRLALVAFGTSWCGPCGLMAPGLRALAAIEKEIPETDRVVELRQQCRFAVARRTRVNSA